MGKWSVIPLLLIQKIFGQKEAIAPPDFLILKQNKEIFGIEVGYEKEGQCREFAIRTSIPTIAIDLKNNMHNRCPKCGEFILYCPPLIEAYSLNKISANVNQDGKFICKDCKFFKGGECNYSNCYGKRNDTVSLNGKDLSRKSLHYHSKCVLNDSYSYRRRNIPIKNHVNEFFAQIPEIEGIENL